MSEDSFIEVTSESWFSRIGNAFIGILIGLVLFIAGFPVLFWNEGRAVKRYKTLNEGAGVVISLPEARVLPENDGQLIHVFGMTATDEVVSDPEFEVAVNAIKLKRQVEMYQWKENKKRKTKKKLGGGKKTVTTYSYSKSWSSRLINSRSFKKPNGHQNPDSMPYESDEFIASEVTLGEFMLSRSLVGKIKQSSILPVADLANIEDIPDAEFHGSSIYLGENPSSPQIGDLRITYHVVAPIEVSIVSSQFGQTFKPYQTEAGGSIDMLEPGRVGAEMMFRQAQQSNVMWTWIYRLGGFVLMLVGMAMILRPLSVAGDVIPFLGSIIGAGTGILSFLIAAPFACLTIAVAWLRYRPAIGASLLFAAVVAAGIVFILSKRGKSAPQPAPSDTQTIQTNKYAGLDSENMDQAASTPPNQLNSDGIGLADSAKIEQAAKAGSDHSRSSTNDQLKKGQHYFLNGQFDQAVAQFSRVIESGGNRKVALYNRGVALYKQNDKKAALQDFKQAAKLGNAKAQAILKQMAS